MIPRPDNPLIVALDVSDPDEADRLGSTLASHVGMVKVGLELAWSAGPGAGGGGPRPPPPGWGGGGRGRAPPRPRRPPSAAERRLDLQIAQFGNAWLGAVFDRTAAMSSAARPSQLVAAVPGAQR